MTILTFDNLDNVFFNTWDQMLKFSAVASLTRYSGEDAEV